MNFLGIYAENNALDCTCHFKF